MTADVARLPALIIDEEGGHIWIHPVAVNDRPTFMKLATGTSEFEGRRQARVATLFLSTRIPKRTVFRGSAILPEGDDRKADINYSDK